MDQQLGRKLDGFFGLTRSFSMPKTAALQLL
jgi:hypothetical protein